MNSAYTYMGEWEKELFSKTNNKPFGDMWGLWAYGEQTLFVNTGNNIHKKIKQELRFSTTSIEFLDLSISLNNGFFKTNLYTRDRQTSMPTHHFQPPEKS